MLFFRKPHPGKKTWSKNVTLYFFFPPADCKKPAFISDFWVKQPWLLQNGKANVEVILRHAAAKKAASQSVHTKDSWGDLHLSVLLQEYLGWGTLPAAVMKFRMFHHQQWILHKRVKYEFITQDEKHVTFASLNKMNGSLSHLHSHTFLWLCHEVNLIYW